MLLRHARQLTVAVLGVALLVGLGAQPATAAGLSDDASTGRVADTTTEVVAKGELRSNAELAIPAYRCPSDLPYLVDTTSTVRGSVPRGVAVTAGPSLIVSITTTPSVVMVDGRVRVTGWTTHGGRLTAFHPDPTGTAAPQSVSVTATCTDDPALGYGVPGMP